MTRDYYIQKFKTMLRIRRLQPSTIETYVGCLAVYLEWCFSNQVIPEDVCDDALAQWLADTKSESLLRQRIGTIQNFYTHCLGIPYKLAHIPYPKRHDYKPDVLTRFEVEAIIGAIKNKKQKALVALQYYCALRVHETVKVKLTDFIKNYDTRLGCVVWDLKVRGKGGNDDIIPVQPEAIAYVEDYYNSLDNPPTEYLFEGQFRSYYSERSVQVIMKRVMAQLDIQKKGATHILRHSRATHLLQLGASTKHVQQLLRHRIIKTTERYLHLDKTDLRVAFTKCDRSFFSSVAELASAQKSLTA